MEARKLATAFAMFALLSAQIAATIGVASAIAPAAGSSPAQPVATATPDTKQVSAPAVDVQLQSQLQSYVADADGVYGIAVENLDDGRTVMVNGERRFKTASMYKLLVMYRVFQRLHSGEWLPSDTVTILDEDTVESVPGYDLEAGDVVTVSKALEAMITVSSNSAAYALTRNLGGWTLVTTAPEELGMPDTGWDDTYWSTPADMMHYFELLADRKMISREESHRMVALLLKQKLNSRIPALLPEEVKVAHKTGTLADVRNDGGIVSTPDGRYIIVVMSDDVNPEEADNVIAEISRIVYERYGKLARDSAVNEVSS